MRIRDELSLHRVTKLDIGTDNFSAPCLMNPFQVSEI